MRSPKQKARAKPRCAWATGDPLLVTYHDSEWGIPSFDDRHLFELLSLEGAQAGLSWLTILRKRAGYGRAFARFDVKKVARFTHRDVQRLLRNPDIIRNRGKIESVITNARAVLELANETGSLSNYLWSFAGKPKQEARTSLSKIPSETPESRALSKDLRKRGFRFVGPTTCYAFMQAVGMVNDHEVGCFCYRPIQKLASGLDRASRRPISAGSPVHTPTSRTSTSSPKSRSSSVGSR